ncbi:hypothetical protein K438DRAFT_1955785 [Mycena galopus ATCC 62051]|nr:hypothetical protein K438DRAFT_1955785 [Mycena galopus ATCC 62051]
MPVDLQDLNVNVMLEILHSTDVYTAVCMTRVNRHFRTIALDKNIWISFAGDFVSQPIPSVPTLDSELLLQYLTGDLIDFVKVRIDFIKVRRWRHNLQKTFLSNTKTLPKEEEIPLMNDLFMTVEGYQNMTVKHLMFTKIGKVMRPIYLLELVQVPRDCQGNPPSVRPSIRPAPAHRTALLPRPILRPEPLPRPALPVCPAFHPEPQAMPPPGTSPPVPPDSVHPHSPSSGRSHWNLLCNQARDQY